MSDVATPSGGMSDVDEMATQPWYRGAVRDTVIDLDVEIAKIKNFNDGDLHEAATEAWVNLGHLVRWCNAQPDIKVEVTSMIMNRLLDMYGRLKEVSHRLP